MYVEFNVRICMSSFVCTYVSRVLCAYMYVACCVRICMLRVVCTYVCCVLCAHMYVECCVCNVSRVLCVHM